VQKVEMKDTLMLLVRWHKGRPVCKSTATTVDKSVLLGISLTCSNSEKLAI